MKRQVSRELKVHPSKIHRLFYPQVPAVLSTISGGRVSAMPVVSYAAVSTSPPLVIVACDPRSFTLQLALDSRAFSLSILGKSKVKAVEKLAVESGRRVRDKLYACGLAHSRGAELDIPVLRNAEATLECEVRSGRRLGDHVLLVGVVRACRASKKFKGSWNFERYRPILYTGWKAGLTTYEGADS